MLEAAGTVVNVTQVVVVEVDDRPGGLSSALMAIDGAGLAVEYLYAFGAGSKPGKAAIVFHSWLRQFAAIGYSGDEP